LEKSFKNGWTPGVSPVQRDRGGPHGGDQLSAWLRDAVSKRNITALQTGGGGGQGNVPPVAQGESRKKEKKSTQEKSGPSGL